jgi:anti-sigma regulatory factor (Ser/Thr protein kinase)
MDRRLVSIGVLSKELGLSISYVRQLTSEGVFQAERTEGGHRRYDLSQATAAWVNFSTRRAARTSPRDGGPPAAFAPGPIAAITRTLPSHAGSFDLAGLAEHTVWPEFKAALALEPGSPASSMSGYVFLEMLNNAIDHSHGTQVLVRVWRDDAHALIEIADDGMGAFANLMQGLRLANLFEAVQELNKGKRTTAPAAHTGEGIFFTSKLVESFVLSANGLCWTVDNVRGDVALGLGDVQQGTRVRLMIDPATTKDVQAAFREYTDEERGFTKTRPTVKLYELGVDFISRSEARRLMVGMEQFTEIRVDFAGVAAVGQGFVDELVRVWPSTHPGTLVTCENMNDAVEFMVKRGLARIDGP